MEQRALHLTTPSDVVLALYDACQEADTALASGDDRGALAAMRAIADLVAADAPFHRIDPHTVSTGPVVEVRRLLASRAQPERVVVHGDVVVALRDADAIDVFRVADGRVGEAWCLVRSA